MIDKPKTMTKDEVLALREELLRFAGHLESKHMYSGTCDKVYKLVNSITGVEGLMRLFPDNVSPTTGKEKK
jgi:hypothetical protein